MRLAPHGRHFDAPSAGDVIAGDGPGRLDETLRRTGVNHLAAVLAGTESDVDHPIRPLDGFLVVFDDNQRVAEVAQMVQRLDETRVVTLVQSDRWLVEHVHDADQSGADLRGKPDALGLAAGQRLGRARQRQVVQADIVEESQPGPDLLDHFAGDRRRRSLQFQPIDPR